VKILFVNAGGRVGGAEQSLLVLATEMVRRGVTVMITCPPESELGERCEELSLPWRPVTFVEHAVARSPARWLVSVAALVRILRSGSWDLVHANGYRAIPTAVPAARLAGRPVVLHLRDMKPPPSRISRALMRRAARWIAISEAVRREALGVSTSVPCAVVPNGVDIQRFRDARENREAARGRLGIEPSDVAFVFVGRLLRWKGPEDFVAAALRMSDAPGLRFFVIGDEWQTPGEAPGLRESLERSVRESGARDRIRFLGARSDVPELLAGMDVLVVPSREPEPFGRVAIEGMAAGLPVIGTRDGGLEELVVHGESGLLVGRGEPSEVEAAMRLLAGDCKQLEAMGRAGARLAERYAASEHCAQVMRQFDCAQRPGARK